jgi:hypothetical protein
MNDKEIDQRIRILTAMASNLTPYLYEEELFGHLGDHLPKLTVGGLLLRLHQFEALLYRLSPEQQTYVHDARINFEQTRNEWMVHYEEKLRQELKSRIGALAWYLEECATGERSCSGDWRNEAEKRTIVAHLQQAAEAAEIFENEFAYSIAEVDGRIRRFFEAGEFIWDEDLKNAYPKADYWWLYGTMRDRD